MWVMLSPQEREAAMAVLGKSLTGEHSPALGNFSLSPGERAGVRASVNSN